MRPSLDEIKRTILATAERQVLTTPMGEKLCAADPVSMARLVTAIVNNVSQVVGGMFDECCGEEQ